MTLILFWEENSNLMIIKTLGKSMLNLAMKMGR